MSPIIIIGSINRYSPLFADMRGLSIKAGTSPEVMSPNAGKPGKEEGPSKENFCVFAKFFSNGMVEEVAQRISSMRLN